MFNKEKKVQECDATMIQKKPTAGDQKNLCKNQQQQLF